MRFKNKVKYLWKTAKTACKVFLRIMRTGYNLSFKESCFDSYVCFDYCLEGSEFKLNIEASTSELGAMGLIQQYINNQLAEKQKAGKAYHNAVDLSFLLRYFPHMEIKKGSNTLSHGLFIWKDFGVLYIPKNLHIKAKNDSTTLQEVVNKSKLEIRILF